MVAEHHRSVTDRRRRADVSDDSHAHGQAIAVERNAGIEGMESDFEVAKRHRLGALDIQTERDAPHVQRPWRSHVPQGIEHLFVLVSSQRPGTITEIHVPS